GRNKKRYAPVVEVLEVLRLLSTGAGVLPPLTGLPAEHDLLAGPVPLETPPTTQDTWDTALHQTQLADLLGPAQSDADVQSGLEQLDRYLSRAWYRAGIAPQQHDDCTQAVYVTLLSNLGRTGFDHLLGDIGRLGIREVLSRETPEGPDFFRA